MAEIYPEARIRGTGEPDRVYIRLSKEPELWLTDETGERIVFALEEAERRIREQDFSAPKIKEASDAVDDRS